MEKSLAQDFILIMNKWKKLIHKIQSKNKTSVFPGEFMMLNAIYQRINCIKENNSKELGVKVSELSENLHSTMPATSKMLNNLEDKGYILRITDTKDRRVVYINLTESGTAIIKNAFAKMHELSVNAIIRLGEEDAKELIRILTKFYDAMDTELYESDSKDINST
ncbi:MAG: MarR family transcriptional regulator [Anaerocolumna sp.]|nr:MarR family transcriptional regulator [Anaerocolumna sp.]